MQNITYVSQVNLYVMAPVSYIAFVTRNNLSTHRSSLSSQPQYLSQALSIQDVNTIAGGDVEELIVSGEGNSIGTGAGNWAVCLRRMIKVAFV